MKYVQFINTDDKNLIEATLLSAWSVRRYGNLPSDTEFILYTTCTPNLDNDTIRKVYDTVLPPTENTKILDTVDWSKVPVLDKQGWYQKNFRTGRVCWTKFLCFLGTPCNGEPVIFTDYDVLCTDSLYKIIPYGKYTWGGVLWAKDNCNGGLLIKTEAFDKSDATEKMIEPLVNQEYYDESFKLCPYNDERGTTWYMSKYRKDTFLSIPREYNYGVIYAHNRGIPVKDLKMIHYIGYTKPWMNPHPKYQEFTDKWNSEMAKMKEELNIE